MFLRKILISSSYFVNQNSWKIIKAMTLLFSLPSRLEFISRTLWNKYFSRSPTKKQKKITKKKKFSTKKCLTFTIFVFINRNSKFSAKSISFSLLSKLARYKKWKRKLFSTQVPLKILDKSKRRTPLPLTAVYWIFFGKIEENHFFLILTYHSKFWARQTLF